MKIPKLRFKEFSGEWEEKKLENIFEISKSKYNPLKETKEYPCVELESLSQKTGEILKTFNSLEQKSIKNKFLKDEVLFGKLRPYLKKYWYSSFEGVCSSEIWVLNSKNNINKFIYYFIQGENFISLANATIGTKMPRADWSLMKNELFPIPTLQEQKKISNFLSSVDKKISLTEEKLNLFKEYKKGMMQKIFKQEIRFKDENGQDYPDWEKLKMKNIYRFSQGLQIAPENQFLIKDTGMERFIRIIDVTQNIDEIRYIKDVDSKYKVTYDDIFIVRYGASAGTIGFNFSGIIANNLFKLINLTNKVYSKFNYYQLTLNTIQEKIIQTSASTSMPALSFKGIENIKINLPCLEEQRKIADFLSSIDNKIENLSNELENLKLFKKGLLQKMFV